MVIESSDLFMFNKCQLIHACTLCYTDDPMQVEPTTETATDDGDEGEITHANTNADVEIGDKRGPFKAPSIEHLLPSGGVVDGKSQGYKLIGLDCEMVTTENGELNCLHSHVICDGHCLYVK